MRPPLALCFLLSLLAIIRAPNDTGGTETANATSPATSSSAAPGISAGTTAPLRDTHGSKRCNSKYKTQTRKERDTSALARLLQKRKGGPFPEGWSARNGTDETGTTQQAGVNRQETGGAQIDTQRDLLDPPPPPSHPGNSKLNISSVRDSQQPDRKPTTSPQTPAGQSSKLFFFRYRNREGAHLNLNLHLSGLAFWIFTLFMLFWCCTCCICCI